MPYCTYIGGDCPHSLSALACAAASTVWCRNRRDENERKAKEKESQVEKEE